MLTIERSVSTEAEMEALGASLAARLGGTRLVYLHGPLGAGKTTLVRGMLRALGHAGAVKSPTFTLVEPYALPDLRVYHFDLYRLNDPEELELMGVRDYFPQGVCVVEWAERAHGFLPDPDVDVMIQPNAMQRTVRMTARTSIGENTLDAFS